MLVTTNILADRRYCNIGACRDDARWGFTYSRKAIALHIRHCKRGACGWSGHSGQIDMPRVREGSRDRETGTDAHIQASKYKDT